MTILLFFLSCYHLLLLCEKIYRVLVPLILKLNRCNRSVAKLKPAFCCIKSALISWMNDLFLHCRSPHSERFFICSAKFEKRCSQTVQWFVCFVDFWKECQSLTTKWLISDRTCLYTGVNWKTNVVMMRSVSGWLLMRSKPTSIVYWQSGNLMDFFFIVLLTTDNAHSPRSCGLPLPISLRATYLALNPIYNMSQQFFYV